MVSTKTIEKPLSAKHMDFVNYWLINGHNASQAYAKAYPNTKNGYNAHGARLIAKGSIRAEIVRRTAKLADKYELKAEKVISRLSKIGGLTPATAEDKLLTTTSADQIRSLDLLGKHLKLWDRAGEADQTEQQTLDKAKSICAKRLAEQIVLNSNRRRVESEVVE